MSDSTAPDPGGSNQINSNNPWHTQTAKVRQRRGLRDHPGESDGNQSDREVVSPSKQKGKSTKVNPLEDDDISFLPPIYLYNNACPTRVSNLDLCQAAKRLLSGNHLIAAQRFGPLWHLYPKSLEARARLVGKNLEIGTYKKIMMFSKNPSNYVDDFGQPLPGTKLIIDKAPMPMSNTMIKERLMKEFGLKPRSGMKFEPLGYQTAWLSGRRFMYIDLPTKNLPLTINIGNPSLPISLYYKEQDRNQVKQPVSGITVQTEPTQAGIPVVTESIQAGPIVLTETTQAGHETSATQSQLIPEGIMQDESTTDTGKARCFKSDPLEPG